MQLAIFPNEPKDSKWSEFTISVDETTSPLMAEIVAKTSLIRISDLQMIERILRKHLTEKDDKNQETA